MKHEYSADRQIVFSDKPSGFATHAVDINKKGFVELLSEQLGQKLWVVHRLDKTTSGAIAFATSSSKAEELREHFAQKKIQKKYWFVTDRFSSIFDIEKTFTEPYLHSSEIRKDQTGLHSDLQSQTPNSQTLFRLIKRSPFFALWEAQPLSGKQHQIRLHAADIGLPILGDTLYGGSEFAHLCLHSHSILIPGEKEFTTPAPRFFERLGSARDIELAQMLSAIDRRQRLFDILSNQQQCYRLMHDENPNYRLDQLGPVLWCHWYKETAPSSRDLERLDYLRYQLNKNLIIQIRQNRGQNPNEQTQILIGHVPEKWIAQEGSIKIEFRREQGLSAGLFLDQRKNREAVQNLAQNKKVLNLFAYTGLFSIAAALGQAQLVTTVDLSKKFIEWSQANWQLNQISGVESEWSASDCIVYLKGAIKRNRNWDIIICDPPSFSRTGKDVFRLKQDLEGLLELCLQVLSPGGRLLFSCNHEGITQEELSKRASNVCQAPQHKSRHFKIHTEFKITEGSRDWDFELPNQPALLKSIWIEKPKT